ncbi:hypothetical protein SteCoe_16315 [Stentor coeruleus]|uniref:Uncharacterized protein n=1 Tax=Stentor coeruleus TaxID=5963 RepID=A0A1R2C1K4_9CILI|nr:hypothetical protein SteCoe_16315 [Stentor coeruleus]
MSCLSYIDEHLAWQQRVQKEVATAVNFNIVPDNEIRSSRKSSTISASPVKSLNDTQKTSSSKVTKKNLAYADSNIPTEVRGKHDRSSYMNRVTIESSNKGQQGIFNDLSSLRNGEKRYGSMTSSMRKSISPREEEILDRNIKELTRLLKIERVKRLIMKKRMSIS